MENTIPLLSTIAFRFTAQDIMRPVSELVTASDDITAHQKLQEHPDYDVIPIIDDRGQIASFLERGNEVAQSIDFYEHVVAGSIGILDLVDVLAKRPFSFVITKTEIDGYVHFSDLAQRVSELAFYIIIQAFEQYLAEQIRPYVTEESLASVLTKDQSSTIRGRMKKLTEDRAELDYLRLLGFRNIMQYAQYHSYLTLSAQDMNDIVEVRNSVSHAPEPFIQKHSDVERLSRVKRHCMDVLRSKDD